MDAELLYAKIERLEAAGGVGPFCGAEVETMSTVISISTRRS